MADTADSTIVDRALSDLLQLGGFEDGADDIDVNCQPLGLETRFRATEAASAALAAGAYVASQLHERPGKVTLATRHAEASLQSYLHVKYEDAARAPVLARANDDVRAMLAGFQQTGDGRWMYMHPAFPHNTEALLELLGHPQDAEAVHRSLEQWEAPVLERTIMERGLCSAMVRTPEEWDASEPGQILNSRPIVEVIQLGDAPPRPHQAGARPLDGYKVLDLTRVLAGPTCARTLASYGAQAMRVAADGLPFVPAFVAETGLGKRSTFIDLKREAGRKQLRDLVGQADVFSQGYRSGAMERMGFGVGDVITMHPGIVYVSINCYGHEGPFRPIPGWEQLAQTVTGMAHVHGQYHNDGIPELQPAAVTDYTTGYLAAYGALMALLRQRRYGGSYWVRVSLSRTGVWMRSLGLREAHEAEPFTDAEIGALRSRIDTQWGPMHHLKPAVQLSSTEIGWQLPPVPLGTHPPAFAA